MKGLFQKRSILLRYFILLVFIIDISYTFKQNYGKTMDGDLINIVTPGENYSKVLKDPFGFKVLMRGERYEATNRYFCHKSMQVWFRQVIKITGVFFKDKVTNLFVTAALFKTLIWLLVVLIVAAYTTLSFDLKKDEFLMAMFLAMPFIQVNGFNGNIGIIDPSISYTFFYGFPLCLLLIWLYPFYKYGITNDAKTGSFTIFKHIQWIILGVFISFSGPIISPLVILIGLCILTYMLITSFRKRMNDPFLKRGKDVFLKIPSALRFHFIFVFCWCLYSYYIGRFNSENPLEMPALPERYHLLMIGIGKFFTGNVAYLFILLLLTVNGILLKRKPYERSAGRFTWMAVLFSIGYVFLLPLGGYREYRPYIIRYDTFMPVTFLVLFYITYTSWLIIQKPTRKYLVFISIILAIFWICDTPRFHNNACEKYYLRLLSKTPLDTLILNKDCNILEWHYGISYPQTKNVSVMLVEWGITGRPVYYIQK